MAHHSTQSFEALVEHLRSQVKTLRTERNNLRAMYENAKDRKEIKRLQKKVEEQGKIIDTQNEIIILLQEQNETLKLRVDELERMVFGKHKHKNPPGGSRSSQSATHGQLPSSDISNTPVIPKRPPFSYRRQIPEETSITGTEYAPLSACPDCGEALRKIKIIERFVEDIPSLEILKHLLHTVTKHSIETGYCPCCKKRKTATPIPNQTVSIGENIRGLICYSSIIQNQTYSQISRFLSDFAGIRISDGEMANILETEKKKLVPECEAIKERIRKNPVRHSDETGWPVAKEEQGKYAWAMTNPGPKSEVIFLMGRSRGKGNIAELHGKDPNPGVDVTDDYGAYRNTFEKHQLCWAHPLRKFRDLSESPSLTNEKATLCKETYEAFRECYTELRKLLDEENGYYENTGEWKKKEIGKQEHILRKKLRILAKPNQEDPKKLRTLKESLRKNEDKYFICLSGPGIPADNNKAERTLRHIVLKRKMSQGSKTQKGADVFGVLATVLLSLKAKHPDNFFTKYHELRTSLV